MLHFLELVLRVALCSAGILLIYASLAYETEDGKIQSLLEEWWVRVDDLRQQALVWHIAILRLSRQLQQALSINYLGLDFGLFRHLVFPFAIHLSVLDSSHYWLETFIQTLA